MAWSKEQFQYSAMFMVVILFIASAVTSCQEIRYTVFSKTAVATIIDSKPIMQVGRRVRREPTMQMLTYTFADTDGTPRTEKDDVLIDYVPTLQDQTGRNAVAIEFIPGSPEASRIPAEGRWVLIALFLVMSGAMVFVGVRFWNSYYESQRRWARKG
jgi:hypothetical protein